MKYKATTKDVMRNGGDVIRIGYTDAYHLLKDKRPAAYTCGVYGWNADVYEIDKNTLIVTGYRPFGNICPDYSTVCEYNQKAMQVETREEREALLAEFVAECKE